MVTMRTSVQRIGQETGDPPGSRASRDRPSDPLGDAEWADLGKERMNSLSELIRPLSKAAVIFLLLTAGKRNGRRLLSLMADVARVNTGRGPGFKDRVSREAKRVMLPPATSNLSR
jgi:hypothetical protein